MRYGPRRRACPCSASAMTASSLTCANMISMSPTRPCSGWGWLSCKRDKRITPAANSEGPAGANVSSEELLKFYEGKVAKWWMPDDVAFVEQLPHTATGKLMKTKLRQDFKDYKLPGA